MGYCTGVPEAVVVLPVEPGKRPRGRVLDVLSPGLRSMSSASKELRLLFNLF